MRKPISPADEEAVLVRSRRRCCICFGLNRDVAIKKGQIAHLDQDSSNSSTENLAFLCFDHHDAYDSKTRSSKNFTIREVKRYRDELHHQIIPLIENKPIVAPDAYKSHRAKAIMTAILESLQGWNPVVHPTRLAHELGISERELHRLLFQLAQTGALRADRRKGTANQTYSLAAAIENRLIDAFVATVDGRVIEDTRHLRRHSYSLDAAVTTENGTIYAVETMLATSHLSRDTLKARIEALHRAKEAFRLTKAVDVILVGISGKTQRPRRSLADIEASGVVVRYVDLPDDVPLPK
jgi:predicted transcriptional regulator